MSGLSTVDIAWVCLSGPLTADVWPVDSRHCLSLFVGPVDGRRRVRRRQMSGTSTADVGLPFGICLSGPLTADVGPVDGRCRARWRQTSSYLWEFCLSGLLTADVGPVDGRRQFAAVGLPTNAGVDFVARQKWRPKFWNWQFLIY